MCQKKHFYLIGHQQLHTFNFSNANHQIQERFPVYSLNNKVQLDVQDQLIGKFRYRVERITGNYYLETLSRKKLNQLSSIDTKANTHQELSFKPEKNDTFQLSLYGSVMFVNKEKEPFITKSFPFIVN